MDFQKAIGEIQEHLSDGETEKAIELLVDATKSKNDEQHENAVLLSGQFSQWKRQKMLGLIESDSELRRIEMSILSILKGEDLTNPASSAAGSNKKNKHLLSYLGVGLGALALILAVWWHYSDTKTPDAQPSPPATNSTTAPPNSNNGSTAEPPSNIVPPPSTTASSKISLLALTEGMDLEIEEKYFTKDEKYYLTFQRDGNLVVYQTEGQHFKWGSVQAANIEPYKAKKCRFQNDGNLVLLDSNDQWIWGTQTTDPKDRVGITDQGILVIIDHTDKVIWKGE